VVFDTRTASAAEIDRIAPLRGKDRAARLAAKLARRQLRLALARGAAHPLTWLVYPSVGTEILVWGRLVDAKTDARNRKRLLAKVLAKEKAASVGHRVIGGPPRLERVANTVIFTARFPGGEPPRLRAALSALVRTS